MLASCATPSDPPRADTPKPLAVDPRVCAAVTKTPAMPGGASIVQPATDRERAATATFLNWVADLLDVATENEGRAETARREVCK